MNRGSPSLFHLYQNSQGHSIVITIRLRPFVASLTALSIIVSTLPTVLAAEPSSPRSRQTKPNPRLKESKAPQETLEERLLKDGSVSISVEASASSQSSAQADGEGYSASSQESQDDSSSTGDARPNRKSAARNLAESKARAKAEAKAKSQIGVKIQLGKPAATTESTYTPSTRQTESTPRRATGEEPERTSKVKRRQITARESDRQIEITVNSLGPIEFRITPLSESGNLLTEPKSYSAKDVGQLKQERPDLYELYEEYVRTDVTSAK